MFNLCLVFALGSPSKSSGNNTPAQTSTIDKISPAVSSSPAASAAPAGIVKNVFMFSLPYLPHCWVNYEALRLFFVL